MSIPENNPQPKNDFRVSAGGALFSALIHRYHRFWIKIGNLESRAIADVLARTEIDAPVFISGLARSGSTILLELLASLQGVATHRYRDFPPIFTPYLWNWFVEQTPKQRSNPQERAHKDRIRVTPESPEAMEESIWTAFFPQLHDPSVNNVLDGERNHSAFQKFYADHIRKILLIRQGNRYISKGNYNVTRIEYLLRLFPNARFIIPVREPTSHIASLMKQHAIFCKACKNNPNARQHLRQVGHFEFGPDRRPINTGEQELVDEILRLWRLNDEVRGWSLYWNQVYSYLADRLDENQELKDSVLVVRYEDLCKSPRKIITKILAHCRLPDDPAVIADFSGRICLPDYYSWPYTDQDIATIKKVTGGTAARFGY